MYKFFQVVGESICIIIALIIIGALIYYAGYLWVMAACRWRKIFKAETLVFEYKKDREEYRRWKQEHDTTTP